MKLSKRQELYLQISAFNVPESEPGAVRLMSAADWRTARSLVRAGLGRIDHEPGQQGQFVANMAGAEAAYPGGRSRG